MKFCPTPHSKTGRWASVRELFDGIGKSEKKRNISVSQGLQEQPKEGITNRGKGRKGREG